MKLDENVLKAEWRRLNAQVSRAGTAGRWLQQPFIS